MYKRIIIFSFVTGVFVFQSCQIVHNLFSKQIWERHRLRKQVEIERYNTCQDFIFSNGSIYLPVLLNGKKDTLQFDSGTGSYMTVISYGDTNGLSKAGKVKIALPDGINDMYVSLDTCSLECSVFKGSGCVVEKIIIPYMPIPCIPELSLKRSFLGVDLLPNPVSHKVVFFDFENYRMCFSDTIDRDLSEYIQLKAKLIGTRIKIYLTIDGREEEFLFDTGCGYGLLMNRKKTTFKEGDILLEGSTGFTMAGLSGKDTSIFRKEEIFCAENVSFEMEDIHYSLDVHNSLMGMSFISQFNWIIDYKNNRIFVKKLQADVNPVKDMNESNPKYLVYIQNNQLIIITRNLSKNPVYPLGAIIKSVNGVLITAENMCEYMVLLNKVEDWNEFEIEVE
jgi:hypothetical protein